MDKLSPPVTVSVTFKAADGSVVPAPEGVSFTSATEGVDTVSFNATPNEDGTYSLTVSPVGVGSDTVSASGLTGSLSVSVTAPPAVSVEFSPASV